MHTEESYEGAMMGVPPVTDQERKILAQVDGHWCIDWDGLAVSAWTTEYDCCIDYPKTRLGRLINRYVMWRFNLGWWWHVGRKGKKDLTDF